MIKVYIEGVEYTVPEGKNMLETVLSLGMDLEYFCWHPAMHSVGACRQCGVMHYKDENDTKGRLTMACMLPATEGTRISIAAAWPKKFRGENIESLMLNHPHDCPTCDEGGECHLQDMTLMSGHNYRRTRFKKRTHENQYLGPFLNHEMNRCIQCYRCVRFYNDYAGGDDFGVFGAHDNIYFGRSEPGVLENEFGGNLVEICPTGVFTDKTLRGHYTRKWDLTNAPTICHGCSLGCNILSGERYGTVRRVLTRYNEDVNGYFICDKGRFGYEYVNSQERITTTKKKINGKMEAIRMEEMAADLKVLTAPGKKLIGIGSPRASVESNFALKELVGAENFYGGIPKREGQLVKQIIDIFQRGKVRTPPMGEVEKHDAVLVLGEDVTNSASRLALSLRQSVRQKPKRRALAMGIPDWNDAAIREVVQSDKGPFYLATTHATKLDDIATQSYYGHPDNISRLGHAVAHEINNQLPEVPGLEEGTLNLAREIAKALMEAEKPLIVSGTSLNSEAVIQAANNVAEALKDKGKEEAGLVYTVAEVNTMGLGLLSNQFLEDAFERVSNEKIDTAFVVENDLYQRSSDKAVRTFFNDVEATVVLENMENRTTQLADYLIPAGTYAESTGSVINNEGRVQRFYQVYAPRTIVMSSWKWLDAINKVQEETEPVLFDDLVDKIVAEMPELSALVDVAPRATDRFGTQKIPRETHRFSGRTAMRANVTISEEKPADDPDSPMSFTMEGFHGKQPSTTTPYYWQPGWNSVQSINKYQIEVGGGLHGGDPGIRLFEPSDQSISLYFDQVPNAFSVTEGEWEVVPFYHIYGTEELTAKSPAIKEMTPEVYLAMNKEDAEKCGVGDNGEQVELSLGDGTKQVFKIKLEDSLPKGIVGLPKLEGTRSIPMPFKGEIRKA